MNDLHNFIKAHPEKKAQVDAMIDGTGGVFVRYIRRALASRQAEDELRSGTPRSSGEHEYSNPIYYVLTFLAVKSITPTTPHIPIPGSPRSAGSPRRSLVVDDETVAKMRHLHDMFNYQGRMSVASNGSSRPSTYDGQGINHPDVQAHLDALRRGERDSTAFSSS